MSGGLPLRLVVLSLILVALAPAAGSLAPEPERLGRFVADEEEARVWESLLASRHAPRPATAMDIGPGSHLLIRFPGVGLASCTANFVWMSNNTTYLGSAGHCFLPSGKTATHGAGADFDAKDIVVRVCVAACNFGGTSGFSLQGQFETLGNVAYARQTLQGDNVGNDFGVVEVPTHLVKRVRPAMPVWGGPQTATPAPASLAMCLYGNGVIVGEVYPTMARAGTGISTSAPRGEWQAAIPIAGGDSGSAVVTCGAEPNGVGVHGLAPVGILTHGAGFASPYAIALGTTVDKAIQMAREAGLSLTLVPEP